MDSEKLEKEADHIQKAAGDGSDIPTWSFRKRFRMPPARNENDTLKKLNGSTPNGQRERAGSWTEYMKGKPQIPERQEKPTEMYIPTETWTENTLQEHHLREHVIEYNV